MPKLIFTSSAFSGRVYELALEKTTIGRGDQNTLVIPDSSLSLAHCEILMHGSEIIVRDLNSSNGTFVNNSRLNMQSQVKSGQTVRFGSVEARLELDPGPDRTQDTEITAIYTLDRVMRERRAKDLSGKAAGPIHLQSDSHPPSGDHTTRLLKTEVPAATSATPAPAGSEPHSAARPTCKFALITALAVLGLAVIVWLIWGRK